MPPKKYFKAKPHSFSKPHKVSKPDKVSKVSKPYASARPSKFAKAASSAVTVRHEVIVVQTIVTTTSSSSAVVVAAPRLESTKDLVTIYALALANGKFYIGKTARTNVDERLEEHRRGKGSAWTRLHMPLHVAEVIPNSDPFDEDKVTKKYMLVHGIENVRGGSYSRVELLASEVDAIAQQLRGSTDQCFICGRSGHFAAKCADKDGLAGEARARDKQEKTPPPECTRCARPGHSGDSCYAKSHARGPDWCLRCGREGHEQKACYAKTHATMGKIEAPTQKKLACTRCGRDGHEEDACYAKSHASGAALGES